MKSPTYPKSDVPKVVLPKEGYAALIHLNHRNTGSPDYSPGPLIRATLFKKGYPFALIRNYMDLWRVGLLLILVDGFDYFLGS